MQSTHEIEGPVAQYVLEIGTRSHQSHCKDHQV